MSFSHECGHLIAGQCCGGQLVAVDLLPWHLPYSIFEPDPYPLITLWSGPLVGVILPLVIAFVVDRPAVWLIAYFCLLANGLYIAGGWWSPSDQLDTTKLIKHGASPISLGVFCVISIGIGYVGFRYECQRFFRERA